MTKLWRANGNLVRINGNLQRCADCPCGGAPSTCPCGTWPASPTSGDFPCGGLAYEYKITDFLCKEDIYTGAGCTGALVSSKWVRWDSDIVLHATGDSCTWYNGSNAWEESTDQGVTWNSTPDTIDDDIRIELDTATPIWTINANDGFASMWDGAKLDDALPVGNFTSSGCYPDGGNYLSYNHSFTVVAV